MRAGGPWRRLPVMRTSKRTNLWAGALVAVCALALAVPAAHADSISYVKDGNVWLSTSDGSRQFQVTSRGGYADASQADDGTIIALWGIRLHRLDRMGNILADFDTPVSDARPAPSKQFYGPLEPAISPDGTKVAYSYYYYSQGTAPGCQPPQCVTVDTQVGVGYSHADRQTAWDQMGRQTGWTHPSWLADGRVMLSTPGRLPNADVIVDEQIDMSTTTWSEWFTDNGTARIDAGEATRQNSKLAFVGGENNEQLRVYRMTGAAPAVPEGACYMFTEPAGGRFSSPTWSPDGTKLAWADGAGVHFAPVPSFAGGCTMEGAEPGKLVIPGAGEPDWGPADVPAGRPTDPGLDPTDPKPTDPGPTDPGSGDGAIAVTKVGLRTALAKGLRVRVRNVPAGSRVIARHKGRTVAAGTVKGDAATLRFTRSARKRLRRARKVRLVVATAGATTKVTLRR